MKITHKYRLQPTQRQYNRLRQLLTHLCDLHNATLESLIDQYHKTGESVSTYDHFKQLTVLRADEPAYAVFPVESQRGAIKRVHLAMAAFFRRIKTGQKPGFPRFRSKSRYHTASFAPTKPNGDRIRLTGIGSVRFIRHREPPAKGVLKQVIVTRSIDTWYLCLVYELPDVKATTEFQPIGIDVGLTHLLTTSDGSHIERPDFTARYADDLATAQQRLSRCKRGSKRRRKRRNTVARVQRKIARSRRTYMHQVTADITKRYTHIAVERSTMTGQLIAKGGHEKAIYDAAWGLFFEFTRYKAARAGGVVEEQDQRGTSRDCSGCGAAVPKTLTERVHRCDRCGLTLDRDVNAARNILARSSFMRGVVVPQSGGFAA